MPSATYERDAEYRGFTIRVARHGKWEGWICFATNARLEEREPKSIEAVVKSLNVPEVRWTLSVEGMARQRYADTIPTAST